MDLEGKRVLITGASRGIGRELAIRFARVGARPVLAGRSEAPLKELADLVNGEVYVVDLEDTDEVGHLVGRVQHDGDPVAVLVNNAGIGLSRSALTYTDDEIERLWRVNVIAPIVLTRDVLPDMLEEGRGHIVMMSSLAGVVPIPGQALYGATKAALSHFTAALRLDLRGGPIHTTLVEAGPVQTDLLDDMETYEPTKKSLDRLRMTGTLPNVQPEKVAERVVRAVQKGNAHVRLPRRAAPLAITQEFPRGLVRLILR
jgi:short-subunit dehydrogenase